MKCMPDGGAKGANIVEGVTLARATDELPSSLINDGSDATAQSRDTTQCPS